MYIYECLACNGVPVVDLILNLVDDVGHGTEGDAGHQGEDQDEDVDLVKRGRKNFKSLVDYYSFIFFRLTGGACLRTLCFAASWSRSNKSRMNLLILANLGKDANANHSTHLVLSLVRCTFDSYHVFFFESKNV